MKDFEALISQATCRDPFFGGVRYYDSFGDTIVELEYPSSHIESTALDLLLEKGFDLAAKEGIFLYLLGSIEPCR